MSFWSNFAEKHPSAATWIREGGLFVIVSNVITVFKYLMLTFLPAAFAAVDALAGRQVSADIGFNSYSGKACGINDNGELLIKISDSEIVALGSGEASLSKSFRKI